ncbi:MAG: hypothetical protein ACPLW7_03465 [Minisyncoccia bacterium]
MLDVLNYFFFRIGFYLKDFLRAYFFGSFDFFNNNYWDKVLQLDRVTNLSINIRYFLVPLWRYYSVTAYFLSIIIRLTKIIFGSLVIIIFSIFYWFLYILWILMPFYLVIKSF